jgi:hypothetical protein
LRQFMIGIIPDVGMSLPANLPGIDIHGHQAQSSSQFPTGTKIILSCPLIDPVIFDEGCVSAFVLQTT